MSDLLQKNSRVGCSETDELVSLLQALSSSRRSPKLKQGKTRHVISWHSGLYSTSFSITA